MNKSSAHRLLIEPLAPLHIGSGEDADAFDSGIIGDEFVRVDEKVVLRSLPAEQLDELVKAAKSDFGAYSQLLCDLAQAIPGAVAYRMAVSPGAAAAYSARVASAASDMPVHTFPKTGNKPYLPGSAIKGAIRTAVLNKLAAAPLRGFQDRQLQAQTLGYWLTNQRNGRQYADFGMDPFSAIRFADSPCFDSNIMRLDIVEVVSRKQSGWEQGASMLVEVVNENQQAALSTDVTVIDKHVPKPLSMADLIKAAKWFAEWLINEELQFSVGYPSLSQFYRELKTEGESLGANEFLLRLGWASGYNAVSTNAVREPKEHKISRRLIQSTGTPLSWIKVTVEEC